MEHKEDRSLFEAKTHDFEDLVSKKDLKISFLEFWQEIEKRFHDMEKKFQALEKRLNTLEIKMNFVLWILSVGVPGIIALTIAILLKL